MANSNRLNKNRNGQMLVPMNVEGGVWEEGFINSTKVCILVGLLVGDICVGMWASTLYGGIVLKIIIYLVLIFINQLILRYAIFEEKYYYKMYKKMQKNEITTPATFWDITSIRDTEDGALMVYSDGRVATMLRLERDTITGKEQDFEESHFDALSDFYKELNLKNLKFVQRNIMEPAGKDPRLNQLDELVQKATNSNIKDLVETQIGYIKKITRATLFESDYLVVYTDDSSRSDTLITDVVDCVYKAMDGAFTGYRMMFKRDIIESAKEQFGVNYFDYAAATVNIFKNSGIHIMESFKISRIHYESGDDDVIGNVENNRLSNLTSCVYKGSIKDGNWTVKEAVRGKLKSDKLKINGSFANGAFDLLSEESDDTAENSVDLDEEIFGANRSNEDDYTVMTALGCVVDDILYPDSTQKRVKKDSKNKIKIKKRENKGIQSSDLEVSSGENIQQSTNEDVILNIDRHNDDEEFIL